MKKFNEGDTVLVNDSELQRRATVFVHKYNKIALEFNDTSERSIYHQHKVEPLE